MNLDLRQPNLTGSDHEVLMGLKSYLLQLRDQLQWAFDNLETGGGSGAGASNVGTVVNVNQTGPTSTGPSFAQIQDFIIKQADEVITDKTEDLVTTFSESYIAKADIGSYIETVETTFKQTTDGLQTDIDMQKAIISEDGNVVRVGTEGFIDIGILDRNNADGTATIGIAIGQQSTDKPLKFAQFVANGITFFDTNDLRVAHFGDNRLDVSRVRAGEAVEVGNLVDAVEGDYVITRWEGE